MRVIQTKPGGLCKARCPERLEPRRMLAAIRSSLNSWRSDFSGLTLPITYDDGFVAHLNGVEVAERCTPATVMFDSASAGCAGRITFPGAALDFDAGINVTQFRR